MEENKTKQEETQKEGSQEFDINTVLENEEFKKFMESYADRRVTDAVKKTEKKYKTQLEEEKKKLEMSQEEILAEKERELKSRELKLDTIQYFKEKEYDLDLIDFVNGKDIEEVKEKADVLLTKINEIVDKKVASKVDEKLKSGYKPPTDKNEPKTITKEDFNKMSYTERVKLATENKKLYEELKG